MGTEPTTAEFVLDRREVLPRLVGDTDQYLVVTGLGGTARDMTAISGRGANVYTLGGAMGAACMVGLGLALARPDRRILVVTGDGELLMNVGSLATIAVLAPGNLSIVCVDNGHYGETGFQASHTARGVDLEQMARGAGFKNTATVAQESDVDAAAVVLKGDGPSFVLVRVAPIPSPPVKRELDPAAARVHFRDALARQDQP